jgi:hypothetical protein
MRRFDLHPLKKLRNPRRHLRSLRKWGDGFAGFDGTAYKDFTDRFDHWRIPIHAKLIGDKHTTPEIQAEVIQCLVDAAANLHAALPPTCRHMPAATLISYPFLFNSEVTLFVDPDYFSRSNPVTSPPARRSRIIFRSMLSLHARIFLPNSGSLCLPAPKPVATS